MRLKIELFIGSVLLAAVLGLSWYAFVQHERLQAAHEDNMGLTGDADAHQTYATGLKKQVQKENTLNERMDEALEANPAWADEPVPADVAVLLCHDPDAACAVHGELRDP